MDDPTFTDRLTGEEASEDVPDEAADRAADAEQRVRQQHAATDPEERPMSES